MAHPRLQGSVTPGFEPVERAFEQAFERLGERGAAVAGFHLGEPVVDLWGGESAPGVPWRRETIVHVYSVTKPFAAVCLLRLADDGKVDLDAPVATYWPEFAQAGKAEVTVRWLLTHQAGMLGIDEPLPAEAIFDWDRIVHALERQEPWWPPGTRLGEQAYFFGHLVGELVRRVDGRSLGTFLREEVADPLGLDFHVGLRPDEEVRCATVHALGDDWADRLLGEPGSITARALGNPPGLLDLDGVNGPAWRRAEIPAVNGHGSARAVARFYAALSEGGTLGGVRLVGDVMAREMAAVQCSGTDVLVGPGMSWGLGVGVEESGFGMGGLGGSYGGGDLARRFGFAYVTATMADHDRVDLVADAFEACIDDARGG
ncbi:MAG: beta-lactamase family protein [Actinobacteria bacterium]|nr:beta-lactamase family protein [Actinomycetota bacterium]